MEKYEFSKHSYDKLKLFLQAVENNDIDTPKTPDDDYLKKLFPTDSELIGRLKQHKSTQSDVIEVKDDSMEIILEPKEVLNQNQEVDVNIGNPTYTNENFESSSLEKQKEILENDMILINEMLNLNLEDTVNEILKLLSTHEQDLDFIFGQFKNHPNILSFGKVAVTFDNSTIIQAYCGVILHYHILNKSDEALTILQVFLEKHPQIACSLVVNCLLVICDDDNITREFSVALLMISDENKINILGKFLTQSTKLNATQLKIINNLLHNKMDLLVIKNLLDLLSKNVKNLSSERSFALIFENLILKNNKSLFPFREQMKNVVNFIPGVMKLKLLKMINMLEEKGSENSFSQTMQF